MSRARVTQIMNILDLPAPIVDYLSTLLHDDKCRFTERQLRRIVRLQTETEQVRAFEELRRAMEGGAGSGPSTNQGQRPHASHHPGTTAEPT